MSKPIKIMFCIDNLVRGGTELQVIGLIERLDTEKFVPYLLTIRDTDPELVPKNCYHLSWNVTSLVSIEGMKHLIKLLKYLKEEEIDIIQSYFQDSTILSGLAGWLAGTKCRIACFRDMGFWNSFKVEKALRFVYPKMTGYLSNAQAVSDHFVNLFNLDEEKMQVMPNGIEIENFSYVNHQHISKVCIVGNMTRQVKRTDLFIKAAALVAEEYPDIGWYIIGDGHLKEELQMLACDLGVKNKIHFVGRIANVSQYIEDMQIGIISSDSEGLSNAILEYMLKGVAVVATNVGGNPELVKDNITGYLVPAGDEVAIARKITQLIEDKVLFAQMTEKARDFVKQRFSWSNSVKEHEMYYQKLLSDQ